MNDFPTPYEGYEAEVLPEWIDSNDHMNLAYYLVLFDNATDYIYRRFGIDRSYKAATGCGTFAAEAHTLYERESTSSDRVCAESHFDPECRRRAKPPHYIAANCEPPLEPFVNHVATTAILPHRMSVRRARV